jgi:hypothetical protein
MAETKGSQPIRLSLTIEPGSLKKIVEQGRLLEFAEALSAQAAAQIASELVNHVATAGAGGFSLSVGFDDDNRYGTGGGRPPRPWPWWRGSVWMETLHDAAARDVADRFAGVRTK